MCLRINTPVTRNAARLTSDLPGSALTVRGSHPLDNLPNFQRYRHLLSIGPALTGRFQLKAREQRKQKPLATMLVANPDLAEEEAKAVVLLFLSSLDERQRRLFAGLESLKLGYGGDSYIADLFGMGPHTVARGRLELEKGDWDTSRLRAKGGGRKLVEKKLLKS